MKILASSKQTNTILVDIEDDTDTDYLWKWGMYEEQDDGNYLITPPNTPTINFDVCLSNLRKL